MGAIRFEQIVRAIFAASMAFTVGGLVWTVSAQHTEGRAAEQYSRQYAADTEKRVAQTCVQRERRAYAECVARMATATRENQRGEYDLAAQQEMSDWTFWMLCLSLWAIIISALGLRALIHTVRQGEAGLERAHEANEITRKTAELESRPLMVFEDCIYEITEVGIMAKVRFVNKGRLPATVRRATAYKAYGNPYRLPERVEAIRLSPPSYDTTDPHTIISGGDFRTGGMTLKMEKFSTSFSLDFIIGHEQTGFIPQPAAYFLVTINYGSTLSDADISYVSEFVIEVEPHRGKNNELLPMLHERALSAFTRLT
jgi:hypothetical protein